MVFVAIAGVAAAIEDALTFIGVTIGSTAVVSTISGMYFINAAAISLFVFGEPLSVNKVVGIGLAMAAILVISQ